VEYIECPNLYTGNLRRLFVAGGITGCSDWQSVYVPMLEELEIAVLNPKRANFPIHDPTAAEAQITWEYNQMASADAISFWLCPETLNPIVLYELGYWVRSEKPIFVGVDRKYRRLQDVIIQTRLARPDIEVVYALGALAIKVIEHFGS
jgi:hypothetical protein